jgi:hypothetical protein
VRYSSRPCCQLQSASRPLSSRKASPLWGRRFSSPGGVPITTDLVGPRRRVPVIYPGHARAAPASCPAQEGDLWNTQAIWPRRDYVLRKNVALSCTSPLKQSQWLGFTRLEAARHRPQTIGQGSLWLPPKKFPGPCGIDDASTVPLQLSRAGGRGVHRRWRCSGAWPPQQSPTPRWQRRCERCYRVVELSSRARLHTLPSIGLMDFTDSVDSPASLRNLRANRFARATSFT